MKNKKIISLLLISAFLLSGCKTAETASNVINDVVDTTTAATTTAETTEETEAFSFTYNPHLYSSIIAKEVPQDHWDALYSLSDALRVGANTFECASEDAYKWVTDAGVLAHYIPAASLKIKGESNDGTKPFENGVGRIYYQMPVDEFVKREADFEKMVVDILNQNIEEDDTDFEKILKLYNYMASNYVYDYEGVTNDNNDDGYTYLTFMEHTGVCINFSGVYAFLLNQAGLEALSVGSFDNYDHEWTYVILNGQGYHVDSTWALKNDLESDPLSLDYFMMTDDVRTSTGCPVAGLTVQLLPQFWASRSSSKFEASDDRYYLGSGTVFVSLDEENKILHYYDEDGVERELNYGEL